MDNISKDRREIAKDAIISSAKVKEGWELSASGNAGSCSGDVPEVPSQEGRSTLFQERVTHAPEKKATSNLNSQFKEQLSSAIADS